MFSDAWVTGREENIPIASLLLPALSYNLSSIFCTTALLLILYSMLIS